MKHDLSQKIHRNMKFSGYLVKAVYDFTLLSEKSKMVFSRKNTLKDDISGITEKIDIHPRKHSISSDRKIKDVKKFISMKKFQWFLYFFWTPL